MKTFNSRAVVAVFGLSFAASACSAAPLDGADGREEEAVAQTESDLELSLVDRCSTSQKREMRAAERLAKYITDADIVEKYTKQTLPDGSVNWMLNRFFDKNDTWDGATANRVKSGLKKIHDRIAKGDVIARCRKILRCDDDVNAHVISGGREKITFCPGYFGQDAAYQAAVWVHELSHELLDTGDGVYGSPPGNLHDLASREASYSRVKTYVDNGGSEAAEQYEAFAINLIGQYFDDERKASKGRAITAAELAKAIDDIHHDRDPLGRTPTPTPPPPRACATGRVCCEPLAGGGCGFCATSRQNCP